MTRFVQSMTMQATNVNANNKHVLDMSRQTFHHLISFCVAETFLKIIS